MNLHDISTKYKNKNVEMHSGTRTDEGKNCWMITVDGMCLQEYMFREDPDFEECTFGSRTYKVAMFETWYSRGGPDNYVYDVGAKAIVFIDSKDNEFKASVEGETYGDTPSPCIDENARQYFDSDEDYEAFEEYIEERFSEYDFEIRHE